MGHEALNVLDVHRGNGLIATLLAGDLAWVAAIEVILSAMELHQLSTLGNADALGDSLVGFEFSHMRVNSHNRDMLGLRIVARSP